MAKFGYFGSMKAKEGKGKELLEILIEASIMMNKYDPCLEYAVSVDEENNRIIHVFEIWENQDEHDKSLHLEEVQELIGKAIPLMSDERLPNKKFQLKHSFNY